ncbi:hypothetical protein [Streptomyces ureilyticus]|uniref:EF-hand domain-containing protein n=1 Tax=Streptomyces ureilyticus TaxID=1775131 RepID=A0ABX0DFX2_9ACTN|nr:hypothetical protein [Streptomyces ureilyticus]NGO40767.1 hypothetical protein [Streptomyces ureilyticus]
MTLETSNRTRPFAAGCVALIIVAFLALATAGILVSLAVQGFFDRHEPPSDEVLAKKAGLTEYRLRDAAGDGSLTAKEITYAVGDARWSRAPDEKAVRIMVTYPADDGSARGCYQFTLQQPLNNHTVVNSARLADCHSGLS